MTDQLAPFEIPEVEAFWLVRGGGSIRIEPCPDGASQWHWTFVPTEPDVRMIATNAVKIDSESGAIVPVIQEIESQPEPLHCNTDQVLRNLTLDEGRLFIGYCCHLHEHLVAHVGACIEALQMSWTERRLGSIDKLATEVVMADRIRQATAEAAKTTFDST